MIEVFAFWLGATAHQLTDPLSILLGLASGFIARRWLHVFALCAIAGITYRLIVFVLNPAARSEGFFDLQIAAAGGAAGIIAAAIYAWLQWRRRAQLASSSGSD